MASAVIGQSTQVLGNLTLSGTSSRSITIAPPASGDGANLLVFAGDSAAGADQNGGTLVLCPGASTGTGRSVAKLEACTVSASGSTQNAYRERVIVPSRKELITTNDTFTDVFCLRMIPGSGNWLGYQVVWTMTLFSATGTTVLSSCASGAAVLNGADYTPLNLDSSIVPIVGELSASISASGSLSVDIDGNILWRIKATQPIDPAPTTITSAYLDYVVTLTGDSIILFDWTP